MLIQCSDFWRCLELVEGIHYLDIQKVPIEPWAGRESEIDMSRATVVLYNPKQEIGTKTQWPVMPFSLLALASVLDPDVFNVKIIDGFFTPRPEEELRGLTDIIAVGITAITGPVILDALRFANKVRDALPGVPIVWGGSHPSVCASYTIGDPLVDVVVKGQGEIPFKRYLECLLEGISPADIPGLVLKEGGRIIDNPMEMPRDINEFPPIPYHLIDVGKHITGYHLIGKRTLVYISSQGCPFACTFCSEAVLYRRRWSGWPAQKMYDDIVRFKRDFGIDSIFFFDNNFFADPKRTFEFARLLVENDVGIKWCADARIDQMNAFTDDEIDLITRSGATSVLVGAESGNDEILKLIDKKISTDDTIEFAKRCKRHNIKVVYSFMSGFPGIFRQEFRDTIALILRLREIDEESRIILCTYAPYPGAPLTARYADLLEFPTTLAGWAKSTQTSGEQRWLTRRESRMLRSVADFYIPCAFSNQYLWDDIRRKGQTFHPLGLAHRLFQRMALWRLKNERYGFRIEEKIFRISFKSWLLLKEMKAFFKRRVASVEINKV